MSPAPGPRFPANSISIVLFSRGDGYFHWTLDLAIPGQPFTFRKLHATQLNGPSWEFEDVIHDIDELKARRPVCVIVRIGSTGVVHTPDYIASLVSAIPMLPPERDKEGTTFTCRVWLREALGVLRDNGVITLSDVGELERVSIGLGEENDLNAVKGGPYKV